MKTGFNLLLWCTELGDAELKRCESLAKMGWDGVEVPLFAGTPADHAALGGQLDDMGLARTAVGIVSADGADPLSDSADARQKGIDHFKWLADCANALGAEVLCGPLTQPLAQFSGTGPTDAEWARLVDAGKALAAHAQGSPLTIAVEPLNRFECYALNTADQAAKLVAEVGADNYGYLFDSFHANIEEKDPWGALRKNAQAMTHVHVSENDRGTPGAGHIDFVEMFKTLRQVGWDGWLTVEAFGLALPDIAAATKVWRPLFDDDEQLARDALTLLQTNWKNAA
ncbi:MAG: sugar phosphate isomerase/epimerase family protein [Pseudomonadota bacterium]